LVMKYVILLCMFLYGFVQASFTCWGCCNCGEMDQSDPYLFVGEYLNITCTLDSHTVENGDNSSKLWFSYGRDIDVPDTETTILNSTSLRLSRLMTTTFDSPYMCYLRNPNFTENVWDSVAIVDTTTVRTEYFPQPVKNFSCIIYDWDEKMECSWDLGVNYRDLHYINTTLRIAYAGWCPNMNLLNCTLTQGDGISFDRSTLYFIVNVTNTMRNVFAATDWITVKQATSVKPSPVDMIEISSITSRCVSLKWLHNRKHRVKIFIIYIKSKWNDNEKIVSREFNTTVCNLKPNTEYQISIVTRPGEHIGYPSEPVNNITTTETDVPDSPPEVFPGSYVLSVEGCRNDNRNVTLYWKDLLETYQNGQMLGYKVKVYDWTTSNYNYHVHRRTYTSVSLPCSRGVTVSVFSWNEEGYSVEGSEITIPEASSLLPPSRIIVEAQNTSTDTTVSVSWTPREDERIKYHTVYYCQFNTECTTDIEWIRVPVNSSSLTIEHIQFDKKYRFGVSSDMDVESSGFTWEDCYYLKSIAPSPPTQVDVLAYPENGITVDWSDPKCGDSPYIAYYRVTWCTASHTKDCADVHKEKDISTSEPSKLVLPNLKAGTSYGVRVQHITGDGRVSDYSDMVYIQPTNNNLATSQITGIAVGGTFLFMFAIAGAVFIYRRTCYGIREMKRPLEIITPKIKLTGANMTDPASNTSSSSSSGDQSSTSRLLKDNKIIPYSSQVSKDSGRFSLTSDALQSPEIDGKPDLFPVAEESRDEKNKHNQKKSIPQDPDYSKMALDSGTIHDHAFRQEAFPQSIIAAPAIRASYPNVNQHYNSCNRQSQSSQKISNNTLSSYRSSSDEKMLFDGKTDEDGYMDVNERSKSVEVLYSKDKIMEDENVDSYIRTRHVDSEIDSSGTEKGLLDSASSSNPFSYVDQQELQSSGNDGQPITNPTYIDAESLQATDNIGVPEVEFHGLIGTYHRMDSKENGKAHNVLSPLIEAKDENSNISMISNGYLSEDAINNQGMVLPRQHNFGGLKGEYRRLDSMENPQLLEDPIMRPDSRSQFNDAYLKDGQEETNGNGYLKEDEIRNPGAWNSNRGRGQELNSGNYLRDMDMRNQNKDPVQQDPRGTLADSLNELMNRGYSSGDYFMGGDFNNGNVTDDDDLSSSVSGSNYTDRNENSSGPAYITEQNFLNMGLGGDNQISFDSENNQSGHILPPSDDSFSESNSLLHEERKLDNGYIQHNAMKT
ncbi:cytokine receptor domeless, partial [Mytilus galloprovincialis]